MDPRDQLYREKYLKYKQKYLDLKNNMTGGKCSMFTRAQKKLYEIPLNKTVKDKFILDLNSKLEEVKKTVSNNLNKELELLVDKNLIKKIKDRFDKETCLSTKGIVFKTECIEDVAKLGPELKKLVENENKIGVEEDGDKTDCDGKKLFKSKNIDNMEELSNEILKSAVKSVYNTIESNGDNEDIFTEIKDFIVKSELKSIYEELTDNTDDIKNLMKNNKYVESFTIEQGIKAINDVINQKKLNKTCGKEGSLLDTDTPSCSQENIDFVNEIFNGISESEKKYTKLNKSLDKVKKVYEKEGNKLDESPKDIEEKIAKGFKDEQRALIGEKFELNNEIMKVLKFDDNNNIPLDKLRELVKNKVNPDMTGGADSELPEELTETPFM